MTLADIELRLSGDEARSQIASCLRRLTEEGGTHNVLILEVDERQHAYVQFTTSCGSAVLHGEAASGAYCRDACTCGFRVDAAQRAQLARLGWRPPTTRKYLNFYRHWPLITDADRRTVVETAVATLKTVYGWRGGPLHIRLHLDW